jgi:hypothetical protein
MSPPTGRERLPNIGLCPDTPRKGVGEGCDGRGGDADDGRDKTTSR